MNSVDDGVVGVMEWWSNGYITPNEKIAMPGRTIVSDAAQRLDFCG
jgi:hypothetical protein